MNLFPKSIFVAAAALIVTVGSALRADDVTPGTYTFTATDGNTVMDGSWVTFADSGSGEYISSWDLMDSTALSSNSWLAGFGPQYGYPEFFPPLTPGNSSVYSLSTYANGVGPNGPDAFSFNISSSFDIFTFTGANNVNDASSLYDNTNYNVIPNFNLDPIGTWSYSASSSVPDAFGTFELLFAALTALGACQVLFRSHSAARA